MLPGVGYAAVCCIKEMQVLRDDCKHLFSMCGRVVLFGWVF